MREEKITRTNVYSGFRHIENGAITTYYDSENEMTVEDLLFAMEGFVVDSKIVRSKRTKLLKHLNGKDYIKYYKLIKKMATKAIEDLSIK